MITEFKVKKHILRDCLVVEVFYDNKLLCTINPCDENVQGFRMMTKHIVRETQVNSLAQVAVKEFHFERIDDVKFNQAQIPKD